MSVSGKLGPRGSPPKSEGGLPTKREPEDPVRVLVLYGPPGAGKTRTAVAALAALHRMGLEAGRAVVPVVVDFEGGLEGVSAALRRMGAVVLSYDRYAGEAGAGSSPAFGFVRHVRDRLWELREKHRGADLAVVVDSLSMMTTRLQAEIAGAMERAFGRRRTGRDGLEAFLQAHALVDRDSYRHTKTAVVGLFNAIAAVNPRLTVYIAHPRDEAVTDPETGPVVLRRPDLPPAVWSFVERQAGVVARVRPGPVVSIAPDLPKAAEASGEAVPVRSAVKDRSRLFGDGRELPAAEFVRRLVSRLSPVPDPAEEGREEVRGG